MSDTAAVARAPSPTPTLAEVLWPRPAGAALADVDAHPALAAAARIEQLGRTAALVALGFAALVFSARVRIPLEPVPVTMQSFALLAMGAALGSRLALASASLYVIAGLLGLPVFANTPPLMAGPAYVLGPTGGYLFAFPLAAGLMGLAAEGGHDRSVIRLGLAALGAHALILGMGFAWLAFGAWMPSGATGIGASAALWKGTVPFLFGTVLKCGLVAALFPALWALVARGRD